MFLIIKRVLELHKLHDMKFERIHERIILIDYLTALCCR